MTQAVQMALQATLEAALVCVAHSSEPVVI